MLTFKDNYPLSKVTTLQIGGPAKKFITVKTQEELIEAINYAKDQQLPFLVIGGGSNLLVSDEGIDCLVIKNEIVGIARGDSEEGSRRVAAANDVSEDARRDTELAGPRAVSVKSGTLLQELVDFAIQNGLAGLQKLSGIPGTVGGAVYGNAGAYGQTISDYIKDIVILSEAKDLKIISKNECDFNYRESLFKKTHDIILEVKFQLEERDPKALQQEAEDVLAKRLVKYPPGIKCPGSFFKNIVAETLSKEILDKIPPEKIVYGKLPAGALLEEVGAKGQNFNGIEIASYHANLFINKDNGTAKDFYELAKTYAQKVKEKYGITLEPEVQLINLPPLTQLLLAE